MTRTAGGFLRLRTSILDSSLLLEPLPTRWLFLTMLILADDAGTGEVDMPIERLAAQAGLTVSQTRAALEKLCSPDPLSRSPKEEGRRLIPLERAPGMEPRGWTLVNWEDQKLDAEREAAAVRKRRQRARDSSETGGSHSDVTLSHARSSAVTPDSYSDSYSYSDSVPPLPSTGDPPVSTEKDGNGREPTRTKRFQPPTPAEVQAWLRAKHPDWLGTVSPVKFCAYYESNGWKVGKNPMKDWKAAVVNWANK